MSKDQHPFTQKQIEYMELASNGYSSDEIAEVYGVSKASVDILFSYVLTNYGFKSRIQLVSYALRKKIIK